MILLAFKNLKEKMPKTIGMIIAIALSIAILFCVFSFSGAVEDYLTKVEMAESGISDIKITPRSDSEPIISTTALEGIDGVDWAVGALKLYGTVEGSYLSLFGLDKENFEVLNEIQFIEGTLSELKENSDNVAIGESLSKSLGLNLGDEIEIKVLSKSQKFYISAICADSGYFISQNKVLGHLAGGISNLMGIGFGGIYNEIYVKAKSPQNINGIIGEIKDISEYQNMTVVPSIDTLKVSQQSDSYSASIVIAGVAVVLLAIAAVGVIFLLSTEEKRCLISKLTSIGATKKQLFGLFSFETLVIALLGFLLGMALSPALFVLLLKGTLASSISFTINGGFMVLAGVIMTIVAYVCGLIPYFIALNKSSRENLLQPFNGKKMMGVFSLVLLGLTIIVSIAMFVCSKSQAKGALGIINVLLIALTVCFGSPYILSLIGKILSKSNNPIVYATGKNIATQKGVKRGTRLLSLGVTVSVLLTMTWAVTKSVFTDFKYDYSDLIFVSNITESESDYQSICDFDGIKSAKKALWIEGESQIGGAKKSLNIIGCDDVLNVIDFSYITDRKEIEKKLCEGKPYCFIDNAYNKMYGLDIGDKITIDYEGKNATFEVGGILRQELFGGAYLVVDRLQLSSALSLPDFDTIVAISNDATNVSKKMQSAFSSKNFFVLTALDTFTLESKSLDNIFDLIGMFAIVFIIAMLLAVMVNVFIARGLRRSERSQYLLIGMEKNSLLLSEWFEHFLVAFVAFITSLAASALHIASLIFALLIFGLYFEFYYVAWVVIVTSVSICIIYSLIPFIFAFKRGYIVNGVKKN